MGKQAAGHNLKILQVNKSSLAAVSGTQKATTNQTENSLSLKNLLAAL